MINEELFHRRLQGFPWYVDFAAFFLLIFLFYRLLKFIEGLGNKWKQMMKDRIAAALEKRKAVKDPFRNLNGYSWDYVMIFKVYKATDKLSPAQKETTLKSILMRLAEAGFQTKMFFSVQKDEIYCKIRCPLKRIQKEADRINYRLQLEPASLGGKLQEGHLKGPIERQWKPIVVPSSHRDTSIDPYDYIYTDYQMDNDDLNFKTWPNESIFRGVDRLKLIQSIFAARLYEGGCHFDLLKMKKEKCLLDVFPLHDMVELRTVQEKWMRMFQPPWKQHVDVVKDYFGEKIGLYFVFLGHLCTWLIAPSFLGFFVYINVAADDNNPNAVTVPYYASYIAIWATYMLEYWKRKEKHTAMMWGTVGFEEEEQDRPEFEGIDSVSPITGAKMLYYPREIKLFRNSVSSSVITVLIMIVLAVIATIFTMKIVLLQGPQFTISGIATGNIIAAAINAVQIAVFNIITQEVAIMLNAYENHRTDTIYEDSLIAKTFMFQFVNSFTSLVYIAFIQPWFPSIDGCLDNNCMSALQASLGTIFLTRLATGSLVKVLVPYIMQKLKERAETKGVDLEDLTDVEKQFMQAEYHVTLGPFKDFANLAIQLGYTTMFVAAYPLACAMSFITAYVELRVDPWYLCQQCRRPLPRSAEDIGTWYYIFEVISFFSVFVNSGLVAFTGSQVVNISWVGRVWIFVGMSSGLFMLKAFTAAYIPDITRETEIQLERQDFFTDKLVNNVPDEDDEDLTLGVKSDVNYTIRVNDDDPL